MSVELEPVLRVVAGPELAARDLERILRLRVRVFVVEQNCPYQEVDGRDLEPGTRHCWLSPPDSREPLAYLRLLAEPGGMRIGRVCTAAEARGTGLGRRLLELVMAELDGVDCVLDSQTYAQGFYARFGFRAEGEEFDEDGIPHITMRRNRNVPAEHTG